VLHRDIKPENVVIRDSDNAPFLIDFGTALLKAEQATAASRVGSPAYMAPEYIVNGQASQQSDIYSFGVLAVEILTGRRPYYADNVLSISAAHLLSPLPGDLWAQEETPSWFQTLVEICLEKKPQNRFRSFRDIYEFLNAVHHPQKRSSSPKLKSFFARFRGRSGN
jgi:serine/threonine-protein kinase